MKEKELSLVVPCYNEGKNLLLFMDRINEILDKHHPELKDKFELIFVSDGPEESFAKLLREADEKHDYVTSIIFPTNRGYGFSVIAGLKATKGKYLCWTHADMQTDPLDVFKAYHTVRSAKDPQKTFVKGKRRNRPFVDTFFAFGMSIFETLILRRVLFDINAQPNLFHSSFFEKIMAMNPPEDFSLDLYVYYLAKVNKLEMLRIPVYFPKRIHGESAWNTSLIGKWKFIKRTIKFTSKMKKRLKEAEGAKNVKDNPQN